MISEIFTRSPFQTKRAGQLLAEQIMKNKPDKKAFVLGLAGELGSGKTTFLQGFARGLGIKEKILSPTFILLRRFKNFYHLDCYRIQKPKEILDLGFKGIIANPKNIVAIEWADKVRKIMPEETTWICFEFINNKTRKIVIR